MFDLKKYQEEKGFTVLEAVAVVKKVCPRFSKAQFSMCRNSEENGVRLSPKAEKALTGAFGLLKKEPRRVKTNRVTARFTDSEFEKIKEAMAYYDCKTTQQFVELAVSQMPMPERLREEIDTRIELHELKRQYAELEGKLND